jgi:DHA2 family methylenomycin A resistance protein-like MFS transporter
LLVAAFGYWLLCHLDAANPYFSILTGLVITAAGVGTAVPLMTSALLSAAPRPRSGVASGVLNTVRQAAGGVGVALFGALMAGRAVSGIRSAMMLAALLAACGAVVAAAGIRHPGHPLKRPGQARKATPPS